MQHRHRGKKWIRKKFAFKMIFQLPILCWFVDFEGSLKICFFEKCVGIVGLFFMSNWIKLLISPFLKIHHPKKIEESRTPTDVDQQNFEETSKTYVILKNMSHFTTSCISNPTLHFNYQLSISLLHFHIQIVIKIFIRVSMSNISREKEMR